MARMRWINVTLDTWIDDVLSFWVAKMNFRMKRVITALIAALAMGFGVVANAEAPLSYFAASFENGEAGIGGTIPDVNFTPAEASGWTLTGKKTTIPVEQYNGEPKPYRDEKGKKRRDDYFPQKQENNNYLQLATCLETLACANENGHVFLDQLVKFTGYEEPQTNLVAGTKIMVWMEETDLYVTCAKVSEGDGSVTPIAFKIAGNYQPQTWYRLTISSLRNIYNGETGLSDRPRAGFLVYINGERVKTDDEAAKRLIPYVSQLTDVAKEHMAKGELFPAIDATDTAFNSVDYQGVGAIDDVILDDEGPEFARQAGRYFTILDTEGVSVASVVNEKGVSVEFDGGFYGPVPNNTRVTITYSPRTGYKITGTNAEDVVINVEEQKVKPSVVVEPIAATVVNGSVTNVYAEYELFGMIAGLKDGDVVNFSRICDIINGEGGVLYSITPSTTITNGASGWTVAIRDYEEAGDNGTYSGIFVDYVGVRAGFTKIFSSTSDDGLLRLGGEIAGRIEMTQGSAEVLTNVTIAVSGMLKSADLRIYGGSYIMLANGGQVITKNGGLPEAQIITDEGMKLNKREVGDGWWVYEPVEAPVARVITDGGATTNEYTSFVAAFTNANKAINSKIEVFAKCSFTNALVSVVPMEIEIEDGVELRWTGDEGAYPFTIAADLTLTGAGTIEKETDTATLFTVGTGEVNNVKMTLDGPTLMTPASQVIKVEYGDLDVLSGSIVNTNSENCAISVLNDHTATIRGGWITGTVTNTREAVSGNVVIPADTVARFSQPNGFAPLGYEFVEDTDIVDSTWYKIAPVTYTITYHDAIVTNELAATNYTVESGTVTLPVATDIEAIEGCTFQNWTNAEGEVVASFDASMTATNLDFYAVWQTARQPLKPGEEIDVDPAEAESKAQYMNGHKRECLVAPCELPDLDKVSSKASNSDKVSNSDKMFNYDTYASFFTATPNANKTKIAFLLNGEGSNAVVTAEQKALAAVLAVNGQGEVAMTINNPLLGFYYSLRQGAELREIDFGEGDKNKLADGKKALTFMLQKPATSGFYQISVTPVMLPDEE